MDCTNTRHQVRRNSQMVHERVSLQIIQVFGLVDFFDHSIDCFYKYSSGISPAVSDCFFPLQQSGLIGQRCSLCGQVFIYEDSLVFVNAVVPLQLSARFENLVPGRLTPESHNYCALPRTTVLVFLGTCLSGVKCKGTGLSGVKCKGMGLSGVKCKGTHQSGVKCKGTSLSEVKCKGTGLPGVKCKGTFLPGVKCKGTGLSGVKWKGTGLPGVKCKGTGLPGVKCKGTGLPGVKCKGTGLPGVKCEGTGLPGVKCKGTGLPGGEV